MSPETKCKVVAYAERHGLREASDLFKVPLKSVKRWLKKSSCQSTNKVFSKDRSRKITPSTVLENKLYEWSTELQNKGVPITARMMKAKALELRTSKDFVPNKSWIEKFKTKFGLNFAPSSKEKSP